MYGEIILYGEMLKLAEISIFWQILAPSKKMLLALEFELLDQIRRKFQFSKHKELLKSGGIDNYMQHLFG